MRRLSILFFTVISLHASAQWAYKGLGGLITNQLTIDSDTIYASTSNGLYRKYINSTDTLWQQVSLNGRKVLNTLFLDQNECLLMVDAGNHQAVIYKSSDRGSTSSVFVNDTVFYAYPNLAHMARSPHGKDTVYLLDHYKKTYNGGLSWQALGHQQSSDNFIYIDPANSREVFIGGENMIFSANLQHSPDNGQSWQPEDCSTVFAGDNAFEVFHVMDDHWYAAGEGIVVRKHRDSTTWTQLLNVFSNPSWAMYMFGFSFSPVNSNYMYVSGDNSGTSINNRLRLLKSSTQGAAWDSVTYTIPQMTRYGVQDLKVQHIWGEDRVWLGGFGVFTYTQGVPLTVDDKQRELPEVVLFPNPASDVLNIDLRGMVHRGVARLSIISAQGQKMWQQDYDGTGTVRIPVKEWASGIYQVQLSAYEKLQVLRFIKQ